PPAEWIIAVYYTSIAVSWIGWRTSLRIADSHPTAHSPRRGDPGCGMRIENGKWHRLGRSAKRAILRGSIAVALASAAWILLDPTSLASSRGDGRVHATFIDVGQGDAAFVRFPHGTTLLVDAGGLGFESTFDIGDRVVAPVLREGGVRRLDVLALTHGDPDHIGGARAIVREFR